ncbi:MAG TPA: hypothetical protein PLB00_13275 [Pseudomonadota bacterium]|nr:hypothetical protein [Pseudomonadota bacterium]
MKTPLHSLLFGAALALVGAAVSLPAQGHDPQAQRLSQHGSMAKARFARAVRNHPELAVAVDLRRLEMLYRKQGDEAAIVVMYQDLLKRTEQPKLREFAERRLRHADRVAHPDQTIAELRARIDAKLAELR